MDDIIKQMGVLSAHGELRGGCKCFFDQIDWN